MKKYVTLGFILALAGCATVTKGTDQVLSLSTNPAGADCLVTRDGVSIARIPVTPGQFKVSKSRKDLNITCSLEGYTQALHTVPSDTELMTAGNLIFGGVIGLAIDAGSGAMSKYDANILVTMQRSVDLQDPVQ